MDIDGMAQFMQVGDKLFDKFSGDNFFQKLGNVLHKGEHLSS